MIDFDIRSEGKAVFPELQLSFLVLIMKRRSRHRIRPFFLENQSLTQSAIAQPMNSPSSSALHLASAPSSIGLRIARRHRPITLREAALLLAAGAGLSLAPHCFAQSGSWRPTANMGESRYFHAATLLNDGRVLVEGGVTSAGAELYNPAKGNWRPDRQHECRSRSADGHQTPGRQGADRGRLPRSE
jgi:hypothetical protein